MLTFPSPGDWHARLKYQEILESVDHLDEAGVQKALKLLEELREYVEREFGRTDWEVYRAKQLLEAIRSATDDFRERYWEDTKRRQESAFELGLKLFKDLNLGLNWAGIWRKGFENYSQNGLHFITDLSGDMRKQLGREVLLTTSGMQTPTAAMQNARDLLGGGKKAANRAQAIVRTEVGRNFSMSTLLSLEDSAEFIPELLKMWLHAPLGSSKYSRPAHVAMHGHTAEVNGYFWFPGGAMRCPHDPLGPASETVHCKCRLIAYHPEWGDMGDILGGLGAAKTAGKRGRR